MQELYRTWDMNTQLCSRTFKEKSAYSVRFSPDGSKLATCSNNEIHIWDMATNICVNTIECPRLIYKILVF